MIERDAYAEMARWKRRKATQALVVTGARQVGKTTLIERFCADNYRNVAKIDFLAEPHAADAVLGASNAKDLLFRFSALSDTPITPGDTVIFLDEIQQFQDTLTWAKYLVKDAEGVDFIMSGSLLGIDAFNVRSFPVGFAREIRMFPVTLREFARACGVVPDVFDEAQSQADRGLPVPDFLHDKLTHLLYRYLLIGGMPAAVQAYLDANDLHAVRDRHEEIHALYESDFTRYVSDPVDRLHVKTIYEQIPAQLSRPSKRFKYSKINKDARFSHMATAFDWLAKAGVALPVPRVADPVFPLGLNADYNSFKLFMNDVGLLTALLAPGVGIDILLGRSAVNFGSIFENYVAQELIANGRSPYYYSRKGIGEVDFMVQRDQGAIALIEVKSGKDYQRHSALNNLLSTRNYNFEDVAVLRDGNVSFGSKAGHRIRYLPAYLAYGL